MTSPTPDPLVARLEPRIVWAHFAALCAIPRPSKGEARLREHLQAWAAARGLASSVDAAGNLIVRKAASPGRESAAGVVLQAHLDMVCQKNAATAHDFTRDPIATQLVDGWLLAPETTLGADNGIGVALMLAALEDDRLVHGPLEALFTVDEEAGMGGARALAADCLRGRLMLNLDSEGWGEFYLGCAGGLDVDARRPGEPAEAPAASAFARIDVRGLRGGHSGLDIGHGRGNAIKLLVRVLRELEARWPIRLATLEGGSARNALPREASATLALPAAALAPVETALAELEATLRAELAGVDDALSVTLTPCAASPVLATADQAAWLAALHAAPCGVRRMSVQLPGVVETSNNLGVVDLSPRGGHCNLMVRSFVDSAALGLADEIVSLFTLAGMRAEAAGHYPGWRPNPASPLLALCQAAYRKNFGAEAKTQVIHAGLECGIIGGKYPDLDMVSFGPTIHGAHAPGERVEVVSVERCWRLLKAILAAID